ncbi:MAG: hypothetical protein ACKV19_29140 [Verrucomicrobiales bacterium]
MLVLSLWVSPAMAQTEVRPYPDPGHRWLGVYGGGPEQHFDYFLGKHSLGDTFPDKAAWWEGVKASRMDRDDAHRHDVLTVYCGERDADLETGKRRLDAWLAPEKDCPTWPELIPAICLGEENVGTRFEVLDGLARHVREKYGIPVFQWFSDPMSPDPNLTADGWIWDSYGRDSVSFRKHLMKFTALRKPAICVPWATDPHWPQWTQYPTTAALIDREWRQFDVCREFNVGCAVFAVAGPHGSVNTWVGSSAPEMIKLRNALAAQREAMHATRPRELPLSSANISARDRSTPVGGDPTAPSESVETFSGFDWLHATDVRGFLDLRLTSRPDTPGFLELMPRENGPASASLVYRFESWFPLDHVEILLDAAAPAPPGTRNVLSLTTVETQKNWPLEVVQQNSNGIATVRLEDKKVVQGKHVFFVRILMENPNGMADIAANRLDRLRVRCVHQPPQPGASAQLMADDNDVLSYEDGFQATRWAHFGAVTAAHPSHGGFRDGYFWVGGIGGTGTSSRLVQRISSPRPLKELTVIADCNANAPDLGGSVTLSIAPRHGQPRWSVASEGRHNGSLSLKVPGEELQELQDFDLHVTLSSSSGVEQGDKACAALSGIRIQAR